MYILSESVRIPRNDLFPEQDMAKMLFEFARLTLAPQTLQALISDVPRVVVHGLDPRTRSPRIIGLLLGVNDNLLTSQAYG